MNGTITDVPGIKVGHAQDLEAVTGCTVVICEKGGVAGVDPAWRCSWNSRN